MIGVIDAGVGGLTVVISALRFSMSRRRARRPRSKAHPASGLLVSDLTPHLVQTARRFLGRQVTLERAD